MSRNAGRLDLLTRLSNRFWPLSALLVWALAWLVFALLRSVWPAWAALAVASALGVFASPLGCGWWRRWMLAWGFPLSLFSLGMALLPAWVWLLPLLLLLLVYPLNAWRDAPIFPTPKNALKNLSEHAKIAHNAHILDAGCGLGDGLLALRLAYPTARFSGLEWSWPLRAWCALRCPWARVRQGDFWTADWSAYDLVYLFQRPESMARAVAKARAELGPQAWLVSLEFAAEELVPQAVLRTPDGRALWLYQRSRFVEPDPASGGLTTRPWAATAPACVADGIAVALAVH